MKVASLEIDLMANLARLQQDMNRAVGTVGQSMSAIERSVESAKSVLGSLGVGIGLAGLATQAIKLTDGFTKITAQLKLASTGADQYARSLDDVRRIAKDAQGDLGATGTLYARIANATAPLFIGQKRVADITESVTLALKVSGATAEESASAMLQLSQSFASGTLRGEEFNAVNEAAPRLMKALADGLGVPVGALKNMASQGLITSQVLADNIPKALEKLREEAKQTQTIGGGFTLVKNALMELVGTQAQASGAVSVITQGLGLLADNLGTVITAAGGLIAVKLTTYLAGLASAGLGAVNALTDMRVATAASTAASVVAAEATVAETAAKTASLAVSADALALAREEQLIKLARAEALAAESAAILASTAAQGTNTAAVRAATLATADLTVAETARKAAITELAVLGTQQKVLTQSQIAATEAQTVAQAGLTSAMAGTSVASKALSGALGLVGGPIGLLTIALIAGVAAWMNWGSAADENVSKVVAMKGDIQGITTAFGDLNLSQQDLAFKAKTKQLNDAVEAQKGALRELTLWVGASAPELPTQDLQNLKKAVNDLAATAPSAKTFGDGMFHIVTAFADAHSFGSTLTDDMVKQASVIANAYEKTQLLTTQLGGFRDATKEAADAQQQLAVKAAMAAAGLDTQAWSTYVGKLQSALDLVGMSAQQAAEYAAKTAGASDAQATLAGVLVGTEQQLKNYQKALANGDDAAAQSALKVINAYADQRTELEINIRQLQVYADLVKKGMSLGDAMIGSQIDSQIYGMKRREANRASLGTTLANVRAPTDVYSPPKAAKTGTGAEDSAAKKALDAQVDAVKNALTIQAAAYDANEKALEETYNRGDMASARYYAQKTQLATESGQAQEVAIQKEIDILKAGDVAGKNHADTQKKIADAETKLATTRVKNAADQKAIQDAMIDYQRRNDPDNVKKMEEETASMVENTKKLKEQGEEYGLTAAQVDVLRLARIDARIAQEQETLVGLDALKGDKQQIDSINDKIAALKQLRAATHDQDVAQATVDYQKKATDANQEVGRTLTDALMRGFENGKGFAENFRDTVKNMFATLILKPIIQPIAQGAANVITGLLGTGTGTGGASGGSILSALSSFLGMSAGSGAPSGTGGGNLLGGLNTASTANTLFGLLKNGFSGITDTISGLIGKITGQVAADSVASATANSAAAAIAEGLGQGAGAAALDTAATAAASAAAEAAASTSGTLIAEGLGTAASAATSTAATAAAAQAAANAATVAAGQAASGLGAQLASKLVASWPVALAYAVWQNDKMYKDGVRYKDMDVTGVGSLVNAPMKFVDDTLNKIGLNGRVANLLSGLALSAMVWGKNGMFGGETRYGSGPYVGYSTDNQVQGEGGPSGGDPNLDTTKAIVQKNYDNTRDLITALGGTADALYMFNDWELSPKKGNSFVRSVVRNDAGDGGPDFDNRIDLDTKDYGDVMAAYMTEMKRSMLAGVANSNVSSVYKDYIANNGDLKTADDATLTSLMEGIQKIQAFSVALKELPFANMRDLTLEAGMSLANFMGGLDAFQTSMDSYFNNYYSDGERFNKMTTDMTREFANIGYDLPASKAAFRSMAESLDLSTKAGRDTYVALMNLQQGFSDYESTVASVADAITQAAQQQQAAQDQLRQSMTGDIQAAYERESGALSSAIQNLETFTDGIDKFRKSLLLGQSSTLNLGGKYDEAASQYNDILTRANAGDTDAQGQLQAAAQAFLDASKARYASSDQYIRDFSKVQFDLAGAVEQGDAQLAVMKQQLDLMQQQVDGILDVNKNLMSLADALAAYAAAFGGGTGNTYLANNPDVLAAYQADSGGLNAAQYAAMHYTAYGQGEGRGQAGVNLSEADQYLLNNPDVLAAYKAGAGGGLSLEDWAQFHYDNYGQGEGRAFAVGGYASPGVALVGERGPELVDFQSPGRVYTAEQTNHMLGNAQSSGAPGEVCDQLESLNAKIERLEAVIANGLSNVAGAVVGGAQHVAGVVQEGSDKTVRTMNKSANTRKAVTA